MIYYTPLSKRHLLKTPPYRTTTYEGLLDIVRDEHEILLRSCDPGTLVIANQPTGVPDIPYALLLLTDAGTPVALGYLTGDIEHHLSDVPRWDPLHHVLADL